LLDTQNLLVVVGVSIFLLAFRLISPSVLCSSASFGVVFILYRLCIAATLRLVTFSNLETPYFFSFLYFVAYLVF
jgi:hypothetical protein